MLICCKGVGLTSTSAQNTHAVYKASTRAVSFYSCECSSKCTLWSDLDYTQSKQERQIQNEDQSSFEFNPLFCIANHTIFEELIISMGAYVILAYVTDPA